ncbi:uncharacterized protein LOC111088171 [Limulus polyphemus]|uniref:Uncharacterized protein LOC111088171 n=1 Tax=Limulus polyphemus TaxID=6850 RepID=A0ABM1TB29_LIMPO|nr:uncharacterized protein LOC111088171 [Limulus polyphemus]
MYKLVVFALLVAVCSAQLIVPALHYGYTYPVSRYSRVDWKQPTKYIVPAVSTLTYTPYNYFGFPYHYGYGLHPYVELKKEEKEEKKE